MKAIEFNPKILKDCFDIKVHQACRDCKRYGSGQCPPNIPSISFYNQLLPSYNKGVVIFEKFKIEENWIEQGKSSSLTIHIRLLEKRQQLLNSGHYFSIVLGAGSCKLCQSCITPCRHPNKAVIPIEGCGIDVVKLMKKLKIDIKFPVEKHKEFYRLGLVLWD